MSLMLMGTSTLLIGVIPTDQQIGREASGYIIMLLRVAQGLAVGGKCELLFTSNLVDWGGKEREGGGERDPLYDF